MSKISVVLGTLNQCDKLEKVLVSFETQSLSPDDYEVIVVDSTSSDGTANFLKTYKPAYHFQYRIQENQGKAAARNRGVEMATSPIIMVTDADMIAHPNLLKTHLDAQEHAKEPSSFEGLTYNMENYDWPPNLETLSPYIQKNYDDHAKLGWYYFLTGNISFPKSLFQKMGPFDEAFKGYGWEDLELGYRFFKAKIPHYYLKEAINYHYHVLDKTEEIARNYHKGKSARLFLKKHPELKWFLGLNPLSVFVFNHISEDGIIIKFFTKWLKNPEASIQKKFAIWFLGEYSYLSGILSIKN